MTLVTKVSTLWIHDHKPLGSSHCIKASVGTHDLCASLAAVQGQYNRPFLVIGRSVDDQRATFVKTVAGHLLGGVEGDVLERAFAYWKAVDADTGKQIEEAVPGRSTPTASAPSPRASSPTTRSRATSSSSTSSR